MKICLIAIIILGGGAALTSHAQETGDPKDKQIAVLQAENKMLRSTVEGQKTQMAALQAKIDDLAKRDAQQTEEISRLRSYISKSLPPPATQSAGGSGYYLVPVKGVIGVDFTTAHLKAGLEQAAQVKASVVVLELDTPGGEVQETESIVDTIMSYKGLRFVAFVRKGLSAGAVIAMSCKEMYMTEGATIGAATSYQVDSSGMPRSLSEKFQSAWRAVCRKAAEHGEHPSILAEAMADPDFALTIRQDKDGKISLERVQRGAPASGEILKEYGKILTLTAREAVRCGLAKGMASDLDGLGSELGLKGWQQLGKSQPVAPEKKVLPDMEKAFALKPALTGEKIRQLRQDLRLVIRDHDVDWLRRIHEETRGAPNGNYVYGDQPGVKNDILDRLYREMGDDAYKRYLGLR